MKTIAAPASLRLALAVPLAALALAGCGKKADEAGDNITVSAGPTPAPAASRPLDYTAKVRALPDGQRNGVLFRAIRDANQACQGIKSARDVSQPGSASAWLATCDDGGQWVVTMDSQGTATVTSARDAARVNGGG